MPKARSGCQTNHAGCPRAKDRIFGGCKPFVQPRKPDIRFDVAQLGKLRALTGDTCRDHQPRHYFGDLLGGPQHIAGLPTNLAQGQRA